MQIRPVTPADHEGIVSLLHLGLSPFQPDAGQFHAIWHAFIAQSGIHALVVISEGCIVGFGALLVEVKIRGGRLGHIEDIVVAAQARHSGVGRTLVAELCAIAVAEGCFKISLACADRNIDFYRRCGFSVDGLSMTRRVTSAVL